MWRAGWRWPGPVGGRRWLGGLTDPVVVLQPENIQRHFRGDVGIAIPVAANPGAERQRPLARAARRTDAAQGVPPFGQDGANHRASEFVEVVDGITGLIERFRLGHSEVVGQPQQLHHLGQTTVGPGTGFGVEEVGHRAQVAEDGPAGGLGRMSREDGSHGHPGGNLSQSSP